MNNKLFFLIFSLAMIVFTIISLCTAPVIKSQVYFSGIENCKSKKDNYDANKGGYNEDQKKAKKLEINVCKRENAMHDLEYTSLIFDIIVATLCCMLGLLHYFDIGKYCEKITGIIGLASGVIGFILTIVYVGYSAYIFNNHHSGKTLYYDNGAKYKWDGNKYVLPWTDEDKAKDDDADEAKYKDLGKKQYNYNSKLYKIFLKGETHESQNCHESGVITATSATSVTSVTSKYSNCDYIWEDSYLSNQGNKDYSNKYLYENWLTSIIFSTLVFVSAIGVAIFGLLLFLNKGDSGHTPIS